MHVSLGKSAQIFGSAIKELNHFNEPGFRENGLSYKKNFPDTPGVKYYMESTPHYFQLPNRHSDTAQNIKDTVPEAQIIVLFRDPVARYESAYIHHMMKGRIPYAPVIENFTDNFRMLSIGRYSEILKHWQSIWPDMALFLYDDVLAEKSLAIDRIMKLLGLQNDIPATALEFRTNAKELKIKKIPNKWENMPVLAPALYHKLADYYSDGIRELERMIERDLGHWGKRRV